jgi:hypothetical protein
MVVYLAAQGIRGFAWPQAQRVYCNERTRASMAGDPAAAYPGFVLRFAPLLLSVAACTPGGLPLGPPGDSTRDTDRQPGETGTPPDTTEHIGDSDGCTAETLFSIDRVHAFGLELSEASIAALRDDPDSYVPGAVTLGERRLEPVGIRLKGSSSWQWIDQKPAWKIKIDEYVDGWELCELERITLHNNVWDTSMMAETLAYRSFREIGSPAPRTGYATVQLNGAALGLYTIVEAMDADFVHHRWPGSEGGLWEMTRNCDFAGACDCFELEWEGDDFDPTALSRACEGVAEGSVDGLWRVFDRERLLAFLAAELVVNHPDSYTYNLNNWHMVHDSIEDRISLSPWGADSTFIYYYPPSGTHPCEVWSQYDNFTDGYLGDVSLFCRHDELCWGELAEATLQAADRFEAMDLPALVARIRDLIGPHVHADPRIAWPAEYFDHKVGCLESWTAERPDAVRAWVATGP